MYQVFVGAREQMEETVQVGGQCRLQTGEVKTKSNYKTGQGYSWQLKCLSRVLSYECIRNNQVDSFVMGDGTSEAREKYGKKMQVSS